jgi:N-acetyl-gamma-glutamyl-phosphate reductase
MGLESDMKYRVFVDGQEGTTGLRIHEYLAKRSDVELLRIDAERRKDQASRAELLNAADVAFLCLPDGPAREAVALVKNPGTCIIDASTAHRVADGWAFGLPELAPGQRAKIRASKRIANPGCHATGLILLLRPLIDAGVIRANELISATSITGYSGGGKKMIEQYQDGHDARLAGPRPYALGLAHKHLPEVVVHSGLTVPPVFLPIVASYYKGLAVSVPLHLDALGTSLTALRAVYERRYQGERFVRVHSGEDEAGDGFFDVQASNDTNRVDIFVFGNERQAVLIARMDNLGKGASGAAVQAMNIHLGVDEAVGL